MGKINVTEDFSEMVNQNFKLSCCMMTENWLFEKVAMQMC